MDQKINLPISIASKMLLVMLAFSLLIACKKEEQEPRHNDVFEVDVNGTTYPLRIDNNSGTPGENAFLQGLFENSNLYVGLVLDLCNMGAWPSQKRFPIFRDSCDYNNIGVATSSITFLTKSTLKSHSYTVQSLTPDGFSEVVFEEFRGTSNADYELKGTFRMHLPGDDMNPQGVPDSCLVTGRFHLKRPLVSPKK